MKIVNLNEILEIYNNLSTVKDPKNDNLSLWAQKTPSFRRGMNAHPKIFLKILNKLNF